MYLVLVLCDSRIIYVNPISFAWNAVMIGSDKYTMIKIVIITITRQSTYIMYHHVMIV